MFAEADLQLHQGYQNKKRDYACSGGDFWWRVFRIYIRFVIRVRNCSILAPLTISERKAANEAYDRCGGLKNLHDLHGFLDKLCIQIHDVSKLEDFAHSEPVAWSDVSFFTWPQVLLILQRLKKYLCRAPPACKQKNEIVRLGCLDGVSSEILKSMPSVGVVKHDELHSVNSSAAPSEVVIDCCSEASSISADSVDSVRQGQEAPKTQGMNLRQHSTVNLSRSHPSSATLIPEFVDQSASSSQKSLLRTLQGFTLKRHDFRAETRDVLYSKVTRARSKHRYRGCWGTAEKIVQEHPTHLHTRSKKKSASSRVKTNANTTQPQSSCHAAPLPAWAGGDTSSAHKSKKGNPSNQPPAFPHPSARVWGPTESLPASGHHSMHRSMNADTSPQPIDTARASLFGNSPHGYQNIIKTRLKRARSEYAAVCKDAKPTKRAPMRGHAASYFHTTSHAWG